ncbi:alpha/beta hydrolase-fold protein [Natronoflexus pectinivorans]|uniref:Enterochelin esterase-like enzyme n=1 Tax=Natronoflexus pectinivorans TaxID=682526 RepID=A0A4R2GRA4_9BACT|nr:alpha/beta hydrolase-fold protein [Natronoflexus pectinivorans]TCO10656.1 enterochelin esterase-like enzyme [Natronoflexus pectinivorans]
MKIITLTLTQICLIFNIMGQSNSQPASTNVRRAEYPRITEDSRAVFRIEAPNVDQLQLDLGRRYDMVKDSDGVWEVTTDSLGEGFHYYSLIINGLAVADPASETFYGMGRMASGIEVPFDGDDYYSLKDVPHGEIRIRRYFSQVTNSWRSFYLYTPPCYDKEISTNYPVLYLLHGGGEDQRGWAMQGKTDLILDNLIAGGQAVPMVVIMVDGNIPSTGFGLSALEAFENELIQSIIPFVESNYRVKSDADSRALAGLSMGGLQTLHAGLRNTNMFSYLGVFSSGWWTNQPAISEPQYDFMRNNTETINNNLKQFWIAMGGQEDIAWENCQVMMKEFDRMNIQYTYSEYPGGHTWPVWRNNLYNFTRLLFK